MQRIDRSREWWSGGGWMSFFPGFGGRQRAGCAQPAGRRDAVHEKAQVMMEWLRLRAVISRGRDWRQKHRNARVAGAVRCIPQDMEVARGQATHSLQSKRVWWMKERREGIAGLAEVACHLPPGFGGS
eukprot:577926-Pelagomonas_calceolata.AAC.1